MERLTDHQSDADKWRSNLRDFDLRADQIKAFSSMVYRHAVGVSREVDKTYHGEAQTTDDVFLDAKVLELFIPQPELYAYALNLFIPGSKGAMSNCVTEKEVRRSESRSSDLRITNKRLTRHFARRSLKLLSSIYSEAIATPTQRPLTWSGI